jgi:hypothetical protein
MYCAFKLPIPIQRQCIFFCIFSISQMHAQLPYQLFIVDNLTYKFKKRPLLLGFLGSWCPNLLNCLSNIPFKHQVILKLDSNHLYHWNKKKGGTNHNSTLFNSTMKPLVHVALEVVTPSLLDKTQQNKRMCCHVSWCNPTHHLNNIAFKFWRNKTFVHELS